MPYEISVVLNNLTHCWQTTETVAIPSLWTSSMLMLLG